ncbi:malonyl-ACP O-methyltransferase BioC [Succinivibrio sp.]|uniref:malonyl-ACP O-methyltransferase BioC n=1 Tax=Succinivibrio sp. TaxID=2053619 RepID=UPI0025E90296|nr:malonyl-ACP O-methyltransferase BioC [Succinivibrio sp.]MBQ9221389.1 malonyl-ACP O-methyltransferase BioC [Succinivibrio sp.]
MIVRKEFLKRSFSKASQTYDDNASVQSYMGKRLLEKLDFGSFKHVLEIGSGPGNFTEEIISRFSPQKLALNDISEEMLNICRERFSNHMTISYHPGDIEKLTLKEKYDLIASNACLQWLFDLEGTLKKFIESLKPNGVLAFTSFGNENVKEITALTQNGLKYLSYSELDSVLKTLNVPYSLQEEIVKFHYTDALNMLKTLKKTGVTGFSKTIWTKGMLNRFVKEFESKFSDANGVYLTWHIYYAVVKESKQ